jgi:gamma-D-glutamyl-L-lysine dipeptidyl-peptidase
MKLLFTCSLLAALTLGCQPPVHPQPISNVQRQQHRQLEAAHFAVSAALPVPPPMPKRAISPPATAPAGMQVELADGDTRFTLFVPSGWVPPQSGEMSIIAHFHGAVWFAIDEHLRHGLSEPLVCFALGEGSTVYGRPFKDRERFGRVIRIVEDELSSRGGEDADAVGLRITRIDISSFSAGYGAVREIVQVPEYVSLIRRIVLADSLYAGWDPATTQPGATSRPAAENLDPWTPFVQAAARGEKTFVLTHSQVPTSYANTEACARALIEQVGAEIRPIQKGSLPATEDPDFPLLYRADLNGFHVWGYGGEDGPAHMTHPRHIADIWRALDAAEPAATGSSEIRRGVLMQDPPEVRLRRHFERIARQIEPSLQGDPMRLDAYLRFFEREVVRDRRLFAFRVDGALEDGKVLLRGQAEYPEQVHAVAALLKTLAFRVEHPIEFMPTPKVADLPFAVVSAPRSFIYATPLQPAEVVNEVVAGEPLFLLHGSDDGGMYLCHAPDGYVGWVRAADVERIDQDRLTGLLNSTDRSISSGHGDATFQPGASVNTDHHRRIESIIASARSKLGLPYIWGGRSDAGVDCSGLVQTAFSSQGIHLPRDAEQQALVGRLVATRWHRDALRRGDILFFMGRRGSVSHTAIYLGDGEFIEASGRVRLSSLDPRHPNYIKGRDEGFCFAKRVLD